MKAKLFFVLGLLAFPFVNTLAMSNSKSVSSESTGQYVDNSVLTLKIKSKLLADPKIRGLDISVMSKESGIVELSGYVKNEAQKRQAEQLAKQVKGVTKVMNALVVKK